jgi:seryl-tRNA synthetase
VRHLHSRHHWLIFQAKGDAKELVAKKSQLEQKKKDIQLDADRRKEALDKKVRSVGNIVDKSVPISRTEVNSPYSSRLGEIHLISG